MKYIILKKAFAKKMKIAVCLMGSIGVFAMEPAPFENIDIKDSVTKMRIQSIQDKIGYEEVGTTTISDAKNNKLWSMRTFIGNKKPILSSDGNYLAVVGNIYFGKKMQTSKDEVLIEIFEKGKSIKKIIFADVFTESPEVLVKKLDLLEIGGGWISRTDLVKDIQFDWKNKQVTFDLYNREKKKIGF